jgi:hypothetical protein
MPADVIVHTRDHYRSHTPLCDGEKYLRIRYHQRRGEKAEELRWKKRLSVSKSKNVEQIVRNKLLVQCLDELEPFRPLWAAFQLGSFPPLLSWHCYEVCPNSDIDQVPFDMATGDCPLFAKHPSHVEHLHQWKPLLVR